MARIPTISPLEATERAAAAEDGMFVHEGQTFVLEGDSYFDHQYVAVFDEGVPADDPELASWTPSGEAGDEVTAETTWVPMYQ